MNYPDRIRQVSRVLQYACYLALVGTPLLWLFVGNYALNNEVAFISDASVGWDIPERSDYQVLSILLVVFWFLLPSLFFAYGLWRLSRLFASYRQGVIYAVDNARHILIFALMLLLGEVTRPIAGVIVSVGMSWLEPWEESYVVVALNFDLKLVFLAAVFMTISWIMLDAHRLADENARMV